MKIALIAHLKFPIAQPYPGGLEMHTHLLAGALMRRGHDVTLFASEGSDPTLAPVCVCPPTGDGLGDPLRHASIDRAENAAYARIMEMVRAGDFDIVHNNSLHDLPLRRSRDLAVPMVTALHTPPFDSLEAGVRAAPAGMPFAAVSNHTADAWREIVAEPVVIGNGVELTVFVYRPAPDPVPYVFWSGRIVPEKGLHLAIDAARAAGLPLHFAGPRPNPAYWAEWIAPRLGDDLVDLGHLGHAELARHLGGARAALVTPRWEEPFGLVVAEALACGTPVAGFRRGALPDILDATCGALAAPDDVASLSDAIVRAVALDRRACRQRAEDLFDADAMTAGYEALYDAALAAHDLSLLPVPRLRRVAGAQA
ncbi:glycosyltransferase family 4 protein [Methylobacterium sp. WL30]|uniref:glycosyltransferase family 4 protein n=2 Tax=Methylobacterium TaxID=407 RepID=UPI0011C938BB|nr:MULTISPECIES: glycosyltransferase family 4 protein [unclassified Methylobacterium]MCJ2009010.1 glycosyltransferase family 4 protein [Methylobacterium sp. J-092]MCJ2113917.1 glycosyltransferase family 4 protein [Methylobacterium sp. E-025]TXN26806.1 glycosyltransferase family 4 protein [Methylobacterium sp. WL93]TXN51126.1 glycosyltransferase family 4 protein [Methylobacterium sp. WL119]TXN65798.1 glycosyltransferase family 4 protein [Methylobacterium sp. WL6]